MTKSTFKYTASISSKNVYNRWTTPVQHKHVCNLYCTYINRIAAILLDKNNKYYTFRRNWAVLL